MAKITEAQFEALRPWSEALIVSEKDGQYATERFLDEDGCEIAYANYGPGCGPDYVQNIPPRPRAVFDEDGEMIVDGWC